MSTVNQDLEAAAGQATACETSRVDEAYQQILLRIVRGEWRGGTELKSTLLSQSLGMSRTPVVQALQRLASEGLVSLEVNKRAVVRPGAEDWLVEIHELRELLEPHAASLATQRMRADDLERLTSLADDARPHARPDWQQAAQAFDFALHLAIAENCGNFALTEAIRKCWSFKRLSYLAAPDQLDALERGYQEHMAVLDALRARDPRTAQAAMLFHLRSAGSLRPARGIV